MSPGTAREEFERALKAARAEAEANRDRITLNAQADAVIGAFDAFYALITTLDAATGTSPLSRALSVDQFLADGRALVVGPGRLHAHQTLVTRRIAAPRLQLAVTVVFDWFIVEGDQVHGAGRAEASLTQHALIKRHKTVWRKVRPFGESPTLFEQLRDAFVNA